MSLRTTIICNHCDTNHMLEENKEMPAHWILCQLIFSNKNGMLVEPEDSYYHFCSQECFASFSGSKELKELITVIGSLDTPSTIQEVDDEGPEDELDEPG